MSDPVWGETREQPSMDKRSPLYTPGGERQARDQFLTAFRLGVTS
jgi:hypothetical protein